jgi:hypothetical protein
LTIIFLCGFGGAAVSSFLVFGMAPRFPILEKDFADQEHCMRAVHASHAKYQTVVPKMRVKAALSHSIPSAADRTYADGDLVLVKYENRDI